MRFLCIHLITLLLGSYPVAAQAQQAPQWTVLVLKLVSATHVQPTTGIVISSQGQVLIPADFATDGDEILVLDGGMDIVRFGRPARIEHRLEKHNLAILTVERLQRPVVERSSQQPLDGKHTRLLAYPPAEMIAQGTSFLSQAIGVEQDPDTLQPKISAATPVPNITGAIVDRCGHLVALNLSRGVQSLNPQPGSRLIGPDALAEIEQLTGEQLVAGNCPEVSPQSPPLQDTNSNPASGATQAQDPPKSAIPADLPDETALQPEDAGAAAEKQQETDLTESPKEAAEEGPETVVAEDVTEAESEEITGDELPPIEVPQSEDSQDASSERSGIWMVLFGITALLAAVWLHYHRRRQSKTTITTQPESNLRIKPANSSFEQSAFNGEPPTVVLQPADFAQTPVDILQVDGTTSDGETIALSIPMSSQPFSCEIGRSGCAISIDDPAISRRHARIEADSDLLRFTDLGSTNGSQINAIPCLEGETFFLSADDDVQLGGVHLTVRIERPDSNL